MGIVAAYVVPHPPLAVPKVGLGQERAIQATLDAYREVARRVWPRMRPTPLWWSRRMRLRFGTASACQPVRPRAATWGVSAPGARKQSCATTRSWWPP